MEMQAKTIKGFTLLELLVVITIVSLISAAAYPNFNSWRSDRIVSKAATNLSVIFSTVFNYTQNGSYPFVQVYIDTTTAEIAGAKNGDEILVMGKGIPQDYFADALSRSNTSKLACSIDSTITWQEWISQKIRNDKIFFDFRVNVYGPINFSFFWFGGGRVVAQKKETTGPATCFWG